ncbi:MAG TPA: lipid-A-disaccharide synthase [Rhodospirillales bacterium]|nr:lipid-A-disaccharide synthase [Rhodospirillales bacterium]
MKKTPPLLFLIAGEHSGDALGARLMAALKTQSAGRIDFAGIGGPRMEAEGLESLFSMSELSVMGLAEVLPRVPKLLFRLRQTVADIKTRQPSAVLSIDAPDFCFRVAKRLKGQGIPLIHYVAPQVWAWRPGKAKVAAQLFDRLMVLLPFETPYFEAEGLSSTFVGHPVVETANNGGDGQAFRRHHGISTAAPLVCVLPGSRRNETARLLPVFSETLALLRKQLPDLRVVVPTVEGVAEQVAAAAAGWRPSPLITHGQADKLDAFAAADVALAASGSVTLELAMAKTPTVIAYKLNPLTALLARRLIRVRYVNLINLILDRQALPEFLLENCKAEKLAAALAGILTDDAARQAQGAAFEEVLQKLGLGGPPPSEKAAEIVLAMITQPLKHV